MGRQPCCDKVGLKRGPWTIEEDHKLMNFILNNGIHCWRMVPKLAGLLRCGKSCRLRWINYLRPDLKRGAFTETEENQIIQLHSCLGNRWSKIASHFPGRTDNEIKNHWNTRIKKRLKHLGVDHLTHKPIEQKENIEENKQTITREDSSSSISQGQEESQDSGLEAKLQHDGNGNKGFPEFNEKLQNVPELAGFDETNDLLKNYETFCGSLDLGTFLLNQGTNTNNTSTSNSYSTSSFSVEESNNPSIAIGESIQEHSLQKWVDNQDQFRRKRSMSAIQRAIRRFHATVNAPRLTRLSLHAPRCVEVEFGNGSVFNLSAEFLRIHSPAVDAKVRSIAGEKVISGRRHVGIMSAEPVGNYGVRIVFDDLHNTGIYSWDYLYHLGSNKFSLMRNYIKTLNKYGLKRDPPRRK
ncbi:hypothetical protein L3X38_020603 [Prunus dulcis]|uniref:Uncharacterized protein n=2 Tax=Prunus TaxID=3754 RepID=A0AAD4WET1_PRUDU|nr:hypothetical protein L3X38_020603 [Prunus dulcis]